MIISPFSYESDEDMTLADLEAFCRNARTAGGTDDDVLKVRTTFRATVRRMVLKIRIDHNRESAHRRESGS